MGGSMHKSPTRLMGAFTLLFCVLMLLGVLPGYFRQMPEELQHAIRLIFQVLVIGFFIWCTVRAIGFLRAPEAERAKMEARFMDRLRALRDKGARISGIVGSVVERSRQAGTPPVVLEEQGEQFEPDLARGKLSARQSRPKIYFRMVGGILGAGVTYSFLTRNPDMQVQGRVFLAFLMLLAFFDVVRHLLKAVFARPLIEVGPQGIRVPAMYAPTISWANILRVELNRTAKRSGEPKLEITFRHPEGPSAWYGLRGKVYGYFLRGRNEASLTIPLAFSDHTPEEICRAINHYLLDRGAAVVVRWVRSLHGENHADI